ncbi:TspO/MBR family protein [Psychroserpens algicola]|uniref:Tryptophan-rich sensory protein n=1 Tax=Psychroserpens algicola TaxID=1719034 RepID=A0ABT0HCL1_9FLAO|nr:TspO/MBR family protein [Psychroserpens algicola]MCK8482104.1 tryptophan-rich sensory protein [Psychroserpens algicola]
MKFFKPFMVFLIINFAALGIGSWLMADGPQGEWYQSLSKAPWTPDGWVFGVAWTTIMICFSIYMAFLYSIRPTSKVKLLFTIQFLLNVGWNFIFFNQRLTTLGLITIILLTIIVAAFLLTYSKDLKVKSALILPYLIWLGIATSLNLYIALYN